MRKTLWYLFIFALAMGYLEAAVVVYLRQLFYPDGFTFPIKQIGADRAFVELGREAATVLMLLAVAFIAERTKRGRLICFMLMFGIWDIAYYLWLWVTISWPASLLTWDILFLIPVIWTGPVLAPVLVSVLMIVTGIIYYTRKDQAEVVAISSLEWVFTILAALIIFISFVLNHGVAFRGEVPTRFAWEVFAGGMAVGVVVLTRVVRRLTSPV
jgi:hypothetical protein